MHRRNGRNNKKGKSIMDTNANAICSPMLEGKACHGTRTLTETALDFEVVVVGAGPAGICAAVSAARSGAKTALITDRPILGGSASSEIRVTPSGADNAPWNRFARESGIMEEISLMLSDKVRSSGIWRWMHYDEIYFTLTAAESNLTVFLNTTIHEVERRKDAAARILPPPGRKLLRSVVGGVWWRSGFDSR
jgi:glycine/D-amino acid oxidase-like deaminating enzyme